MKNKVNKKAVVQHKSFSLIEVLVVVAIIGILASLLLPSLRKAREKAISVDCQSRLKQLYAAETMWGDDNEQLMMYVTGNGDDLGTWPGQLSTYLGYTGGFHGPDISQDVKDTSSNAYRCPKADLSTAASWLWTHYGYSLYAGAHNRTGSLYDPVVRGNVTKPMGAIIFIDSTSFYTRSDQYFRSMNRVNLHNGTDRNVIFVDGHVRANITIQQQIIDPGDPTYFYSWAFESGK